MELAEKMDYQRNMLSISLLNRKSNTIGIIIPEFMSSLFSAGDHWRTGNCGTGRLQYGYLS